MKRSRTLSVFIQLAMILTSTCIFVSLLNAPVAAAAAQNISIQGGAGGQGRAGGDRVLILWNKCSNWYNKI